VSDVKVYRDLIDGDKIQVGDEAYTWVDDCTRLGWYTILEGDHCNTVFWMELITCQD